MAGCGGSSHPKRTTTTKRTTSAPRTGSTTTTHPAAARGIASFTYVQDQNTYQQSYSRVTIYDLRRWGPYVTLDFGEKCLTSSGCTGAFFNTNSGNYGGVPDETPDDTSLVDPTNNLEYLPVTDAKGNEFSSVDWTSADASTPLRLMWIKFPAPPASVKSLDVLFTGGGPEIPNVPITTAASGPTPAQVGGGAVAVPRNQFAQPPDSTTTTGLNLEVHKLQLAVGNPAGNDAETPGRSTITINADVLFKFNKSNLTPKAQSVLSQVAARIKAHATGVVSVKGYTDSIGTTSYNLGLSQRRAQSVVHFLTPATAGAHVTYSSQGLGEADPVAPNTLPSGADNPAGRRLNRRVTISYAVAAPVQPSPPVAAAPAQSTSTATSASRSVKFTINSSGTSTYLVTVDSLFRDGGMVVLRFSVKCLAETGSAIGCDGILNLNGDTSIPPYPAYVTDSGPYRSVGGVYLQDSSGNDYIPVYSAAAKSIVAVQTNQYIGTVPFPLWAYYPAPPASVSAMTVVFPTGVKVPDVPISDSAPPLQ